MSKCDKCDKAISKGNKSGFCLECKYKTISRTNVKKLYKLTDDDLDDHDAELNSYDIIVRGTAGIKYFPDEIEKLVTKICNNLDESNKADKKKKDKLMANILKKNNKKELESSLGEKYYECTKNDKIHDLIQNYINLSSDNKKVKDDIKKKILTIYDDLKNAEKIKKQYIDMIDTTIKKRYTQDFITKLIKKGGKISPTSVMLCIKETDTYNKLTQNVIPELNDEKSLLKSDIFDKFDVHAKQYVINVSEQDERKTVLIEKLAQKGLVLRDDSKLCQYYIEGDVTRVMARTEIKNINSVDDVVDIMDEMNFYYTKTNYETVHKKIMYRYNDHHRHYNRYEFFDYTDDYDSDYEYEGEPDPGMISLMAKTDVLKTFKFKKNSYVPKNVLDLYNSIHKK